MAPALRFDTLYSQLCSDARSVMPTVDTSAGSVVGIVLAAVAASLDGLYGYTDAVSKYAFPDACPRPQLERWAAVLGLTIAPDMSDAALSALVLNHLRKPPAGGNRYDWGNWVRAALAAFGADPLGFSVLENARGPATVDIVLSVENAGAIANVKTDIDLKRPVGLADVRVIAGTKVPLIFKIDYTGVQVDFIAVEGNVKRYLAAVPIGAACSMSAIEYSAIGAGASTAKAFWATAASPTIWHEGDAIAQTIFDGVANTEYFTFSALSELNRKGI